MGSKEAIEKVEMNACKLNKVEVQLTENRRRGIKRV